jgi:hypothetical protein
MQPPYRCHYCGRAFANLLWRTDVLGKADLSRTGANRAVCIDCAVTARREAVFSPDDREVPREPETGAAPGASAGAKDG